MVYLASAAVSRSCGRCYPSSTTKCVAIENKFSVFLFLLGLDGDERKRPKMIELRKRLGLEAQAIAGVEVGGLLLRGGGVEEDLVGATDQIPSAGSG